MTIDEARARVQEHLCGCTARVPDIPAMEVLDEATLEFQWGWVFFYQSSEYLRTRSDLKALAGNAPIIVNRTTGELIQTGTAHPIEYYVAQYEKKMGFDA